MKNLDTEDLDKNPNEENFRSAFQVFKAGGATFKCRQCNKSFGNSLKFMKHMKKNHSASASDASRAVKASIIEFSNVKCEICDVDIIHDLGYVMKHLIIKHNIHDIEHYFSTYCFHNEEPRKETTNLVPQNDSTERRHDLLENVEEKSCSSETPFEARFPFYLKDDSKLSDIHPSHLVLLRHPVVRSNYNGCVFECGLCPNEKFFPAKVAFLNHLKIHHGMNEEEYLEKRNPPRIMENFIICELCDMEFLRDGLIFQNHLESAHDISLMKYHQLLEMDLAYFELEYELCQDCSQIVLSREHKFEEHLLENHGLTRKQHEKRFKKSCYVKLTEKCLFCRAEMKSRSVFENHVKSHKVELDLYLLLVKLTKRYSDFRIERFSIGNESETIDAKRAYQFLNGCLLSCALCSNTFRSNDFLVHLVQEHNIDETTYTTIYGVHYKEINLHKCLICHQNVPQHHPVIEVHLRGHGLSIPDYYCRHRLAIEEETKQWTKKRKAKDRNPASARLPLKVKISKILELSQEKETRNKITIKNCSTKVKR